MTEFLITPFLLVNTTFLNQTSSPGDDNQRTFASAYLQHDVTRMLWLIMPPVLLILGSYGNVMTIVVMRAMRPSESIGCLSVYFTALAVSDLVLLWTSVMRYWLDMLLDSRLSYLHDLSCTAPFYVSYVCSMTSAWVLVAMTCQRMTSIVLPHRVDVLCTASRGRVIIAAILITSCSANLYIFFGFHIVNVGDGYPACVSRDKTVGSSFSSLYLCLASVAPFFFLAIANSVLIYGGLQSVKMPGKMAGRGETHTSSRLAKVSSMTTTLILASVAFLLLTLPSCIMWIYFKSVDYYEDGIEDEDFNQQLALAHTICLLLGMSNSAINFYIYILSGRKFREEAKRCFSQCFTGQKKKKERKEKKSRCNIQNKEIVRSFDIR